METAANGTAAGAIANSRRALLACLAASALVLAISGIGPRDRLTWWLEIAPALIALPLLGATWKRQPFTPLVYALVAVHVTILAVGGHYTYAEVPLGFWMRDALGLVRNNYDRVGHLAQGFVPALVARELLLRRTTLRPGPWLFTLVTAVCLAISACYEFIEWWTAVIGGGKSEAFLGTQGDPWDTQWDMFCALLGALGAQLALARLQDRALARLSADPQAWVHPAVARVREYFAAFERSDSQGYAAQWVYPAAFWSGGAWSVVGDAAAMARNNDAYERAERERGRAYGTVLELRCELLSADAALVHGRFDARRADGGVLGVTETLYTVVRSGSEWRVALCIVKS